MNRYCNNECMRKAISTLLDIQNPIPNATFEMRKVSKA